MLFGLNLFPVWKDKAEVALLSNCPLMRPREGVALQIALRALGYLRPHLGSLKPALEWVFSGGGAVNAPFLTGILKTLCLPRVCFPMGTEDLVCDLAWNRAVCLCRVKVKKLGHLGPK